LFPFLQFGRNDSRGDWRVQLSDSYHAISDHALSEIHEANLHRKGGGRGTKKDGASLISSARGSLHLSPCLRTVFASRASILGTHALQGFSITLHTHTHTRIHTRVRARTHTRTRTHALSAQSSIDCARRAVSECGVRPVRSRAGCSRDKGELGNREGGREGGGREGCIKRVHIYAYGGVACLVA